MQYVELESTVTIASHSLRIKYQPCEDTMMIDISTIQGLELIQNLQNVKSKECLFGFLNCTTTPMGSRALRSNILQPSTSKDVTILPRYDAVEELSTNEVMFFQIRKALKDFRDEEKLLTKLVVIPKEPSLYESEQAINNILRIKNFVDAVSPLFEALTPARGILLTKVRELCRPAITTHILGLISQTINEDVSYVDKPLDLRNQRTYAVKAGVNGLLDVARKTHNEATDGLHSYVEELNGRLNLAGELKFDDNRRYYLRFLATDLTESGASEEFINCIQAKEHIECQTLKLVQYNQRITDSVNEVVMQSDNIIQQLLASIRVHVPDLFKICESVALIDMLVSFAHLVTTHDYVRPEFTDALALKSARHPILEAVGLDRQHSLFGIDC